MTKKIKKVILHREFEYIKYEEILYSKINVDKFLNAKYPNTLKFFNDKFKKSLNKKVKENISLKQDNSKQPIPPPNANLIMYWILPRGDWDEVMGDLEEKFHNVMELSSPRAAKIWYWWHTSRSVVYFLAYRITSAFQKIREMVIGK